MLLFLPHFLRDSLAGLLLVSSILCWTCLLFGMILVKLFLPFAATQRPCSKITSLIVRGWIARNKGWMNLVQHTRWNVQGLEGLECQHSYLVIDNHQSRVGILVLRYQLSRRIPLLRFFLKQKLIWIPIISLCWWAFNFLFMKHYNKAYLVRHLEKKGQDLATTYKACTELSRISVAVFNFLEGTHFIRVKHNEQWSSFRHLLKPKADGIAFVLDAMNERLKALVNVIVHYPDGNPTFQCPPSRRLKDVVVRFEELEIPCQFVGKSHGQDADCHAEFQQRVSQLWECKDQLLDSSHHEFPGNAKA